MEKESYLNKIKHAMSNFALYCVIVNIGLIVLFQLKNDMIATIVSGFMLPNAILLLSGYLIYSRKHYAGLYGLLIYTIMVSVAVAISLETISLAGVLINPLAIGYSIYIFKTFNMIYGTMALILPVLVVIEIVQSMTTSKKAIAYPMHGKNKL